MLCLKWMEEQGKVKLIAMCLCCSNNRAAAAAAIVSTQRSNSFSVELAFAPWQKQARSEERRRAIEKRYLCIASVFNLSQFTRAHEFIGTLFLSVCPILLSTAHNSFFPLLVLFHFISFCIAIVDCFIYRFYVRWWICFTARHTMR